MLFSSGFSGTGRRRVADRATGESLLKITPAEGPDHPFGRESPAPGLRLMEIEDDRS